MWFVEPHPVASRPDPGLRLSYPGLFQPRPDQVMAVLRALGVQGPVQVHRSGEGRSVAVLVDALKGLRIFSTAMNLDASPR